jgi:cytochrome c oxidase subunit 2
MRRSTFHTGAARRALGRPGLRAAAGAGLALGGCTGPQSMLDPAGPGAAAIGTLWWVLLVVLTAVFLVVMAALAVALVRGSGAGAGGDALPGGGTPESERRRVVAVLVAGAGVPLIILVGIFVYAMVVLADVGPSEPEGELTVVVTGKQFWWDVRYHLPGGDTVRTANEIHVPVGRRVTFLLESDDVIHSLWIPRLHGKTDLIPGRTNEMWIQADEPGVYRGQCAEYCGDQHTWMALLLVAEPESEFRGWLERQRRPAAPVAPPPDPAEAAMVEPGPAMTPADSAAALDRNARLRLGREVYLDPEHRCTSCHVIRGVNERVPSPGERQVDGPDLTHVASRRILASGLLRTTRGNMAGWLANPQVLKPGNLMPRIPLEPHELQALTDYLMSLR